MTLRRGVKGVGGVLVLLFGIVQEMDGCARFLISVLVEWSLEPGQLLYLVRDCGT